MIVVLPLPPLLSSRDLDIQRAGVPQPVLKFVWLRGTLEWMGGGVGKGMQPLQHVRTHLQAVG